MAIYDLDYTKYNNKLDLKETEIAIKFVKDFFEKALAKELNLMRVSSPLFVTSNSGLNDHLNGVERPVSFTLHDNEEIEIIHSLAKWKKSALHRYNFSLGEGLYADMNAIRKDEVLDNIHSCYVDQWDWERIIEAENRTYSFLKKIVRKIYKVLLKTESAVNKKFPVFKYKLPKEISFISTSELENLYPNLTRKEREDAIAKQYGAVFIYQIGWPLKDGLSHDGRAADYDDWKLNGDILVWDEVINRALELSSMGIRVDEKSLVKQLKHKKEDHKLNNPYSQGILNKELPLTIGGGIGQSRLCMFFLEKIHIGEVQASIWNKEDLEELHKYNIDIL